MADLSVTHKRKKRQTFYILDTGNYVGEENRTVGMFDFMAPQAGLAVLLTSLSYLVIDYLRPGTFIGNVNFVNFVYFFDVIFYIDLYHYVNFIAVLQIAISKLND